MTDLRQKVEEIVRTINNKKLVVDQIMRLLLEQYLKNIDIEQEILKALSAHEKALTHQKKEEITRDIMNLFNKNNTEQEKQQLIEDEAITERLLRIKAFLGSKIEDTNRRIQEDTERILGRKKTQGENGYEREKTYQVTLTLEDIVKNGLKTTDDKITEMILYFDMGSKFNLMLQPGIEFNTERKQIIGEAIEESHEIGSLFIKTREQLIQIWDFLYSAGLDTEAIKFLVRRGYCGKERDTEVAGNALPEVSVAQAFYTLVSKEHQQYRQKD